MQSFALAEGADLGARDKDCMPVGLSFLHQASMEVRYLKEPDLDQAESLLGRANVEMYAVTWSFEPCVGELASVITGAGC